MNTWGAIFDWDGVIVDSSRHHEESWERLAREIGKPLPAGHFKRGFGMKNEWIIPNLLKWSDEVEEVSALSLQKEMLYREVVMDWGIEALPGVVHWLATLKSAGIPCVIGSSTHRLNIETTLDRLGLLDTFADVVSAEDVTAGKPDLQVFLKASGKISIAPGRCVVFEDAHVGIEAAQRAGMHIIAVATTNPIMELGRADLAVHSLAELSLEMVAQLFA